MKKINVIGLGYIGLPTALILAANGLEVIGTDYNKSVIDNLNNGLITFEEKGLKELFADAISKKIEFTAEYVSTDMYILSVPTPYDKDSKKIDSTYVINAVKSVMNVCEKGTILIIESTISPGTIEKFIRPIIEENGFEIGQDIHLVHAPERILPGNMIYELEHNSRTIGADSMEIAESVKEVYSSFCKAEIVLTDIKSAELSKVVENTYRDINIAFANELTKICREAELDVYEIINIANKHPRVNILQPGPGVGGHCISVDPWFLVGDYPKTVNLILAAREVNDGMPKFVLKRIKNIMIENDIKDISKVGLYGLTYKENVDDTRESPTLQLLQCLEEENLLGAKIYDPYITKDILENQYHDFDSFLEDIEMIVILVNHKQIIDNIEKLKGKIILDTKNICNLENTYKL